MSDLNSRDEEMAEEVGIMAELGKFEKEFTMYGCAFYENEKVMYLVSENAEKVYDFMYDIKNAEKLPTDLHTATMHTLVPSGAESYILAEVKKQLLQQLYQMYDAQYFTALYQMQHVLRSNDAYSVLKELQYQFDGVCNREQLQLFQGLAETAYRRKVLWTESYLELMQWVDWTKRDLELELVRTDLYEKTFYAFAYCKEEQPIQVYVDGYKNSIYKRIEQKRAEGYQVSNIVSKTYWYNNQYPVVKAKKDYEQFLKDLFGEWYVNCIEQISRLAAPISKKSDSEIVLRDMAAQNEKVRYSVQRQYQLWNVNKLI